MRFTPLVFVCVVLSFAGSIGVGCSSSGSIDEPNGTGFVPGVSSGREPDPPFTGDVGGSSSFGPDAWVNHYGDAEDQIMGAIAANQAGEIAVTGTVKGTIDFGNIPWKGGATDTDVVVAKISHEGQSLWSRRYGDSCDQRGGAVAHTLSGNVLLAGDFCGKMDFGTTIVETKGGEVDLFVAVIDTLGEDVYSRSFGGAGAQIARGAAVDADGSAVIVGSFDQAFDDGAGAVASAGMEDIFVLRLDSDGNVLWSQRFGGAESDIPRAIAIDSQGNIVLGGSFGGSIDFGGGPLTAAPGHPSAFLMQLDAGGKHLWSQSFASDDAVVNGLSIGPKDRIAIAGSFAGTIDLGEGLITTAGGDDVFLATMDSAGTMIWGHAFGGPGSDRGVGVAFGMNGALAFTGTADEEIEVGTTEMGPLFPNAPEMVFIAQFDPDHALVQGWAVGSSAPMRTVGVTFSSTLEVTVAGSFQAELSAGFGSAKAEGGWDMFLIHRP